MKEHSMRDLLLSCYSEMEVTDIRNNVLKEIKDNHVRHYFSALSADCLRFLEVLKRAGIHANNIEQLAELIAAENARSDLDPTEQPKPTKERSQP